MWTLVNFFLFLWLHTNKAFWKMVKAKVWKKISTFYSTKKLEREWWDLLWGGYIGCNWPLWCWLGTEPPYLSCWLLGSIAPHLGTEWQKQTLIFFFKLAAIWYHSYVNCITWSVFLLCNLSNNKIRCPIDKMLDCYGWALKQNAFFMTLRQIFPFA